MKKSLFLASILTVFLAACGGTEESDQVAEAEESTEISDVVEESASVNTEKKLGITIDDLLEVGLFADHRDTFESYEYENLKVESITDDSYTFRSYLYYVDESEYPSAVIIRNNGRNIDLQVSALEELTTLIEEDILPFTEVDFIEEEDFSVVGLLFNGEVAIEDLPIHLDELNPNDYFADDENVEFYTGASQEAKYDEIYKHVEGHIDEKDGISEFDSAFKILEILEPIQNTQNLVEVVNDDFDNTAKVYYKGLTDVSMDNHIVPHISSDENDMKFTVGFEKNDWLFVENVAFNIDGENESLFRLGYSDFDGDILSGSGVSIREEATATTYNEETLEKILASEDSVRMRFEGRNGNLDYTLTDSDLEAIKVIYSYVGIPNELDNLQFAFDKNS